MGHQSHSAGYSGSSTLRLFARKTNYGHPVNNIIISKIRRCTSRELRSTLPIVLIQFGAAQLPIAAILESVSHRRVTYQRAYVPFRAKEQSTKPREQISSRICSA